MFISQTLGISVYIYFSGSCSSCIPLKPFTWQRLKITLPTKHFTLAMFEILARLKEVGPDDLFSSPSSGQFWNIGSTEKKHQGPEDKNSWNPTKAVWFDVGKQCKMTTKGRLIRVVLEICFHPLRPFVEGRWWLGGFGGWKRSLSGVLMIFVWRRPIR